MSSRFEAVSVTSIAWVSETASRQASGGTPAGTFAAIGSIAVATCLAPYRARAR